MTNGTQEQNGTRDVWNYRIVRCADTEEWIVKSWKNGKRYADADYFTDDIEDARGTRDAMMHADSERAQAKKESREAKERCAVRDSLDEFETAYLDCALWSSTADDDDESESDACFDENYSIADFADEAIAQAREACARFRSEFEDVDIDDERATASKHSPDECAGHDYWLSRNGHGAGFWDGDWKEPFAQRASDFARAQGEAHPYLGDNGRIYFFEE